jgi:hypothetical protein
VVDGAVKYILLGMMIALTPSLIVLAAMLWKSPHVTSTSAEKDEPLSPQNYRAQGGDERA